MHASPFINYANSTLQWLAPDSEQNYKKNLRKKNLTRTEKTALQLDVSYTFNSDGFRSSEFLEKQSCILFLGCSYTQGIGVPQQLTWPEILAKKLSVVAYNLACAGSSSDTAFRLCYHWLEYLKPVCVIWAIPEPARTELILQNNTAYQFGPWDSNSGFYRQWAANPANSELNAAKNLFAVQYLCDSAGVPCVSLSVAKMRIQDLGRDLVHPGPRSHCLFARTMLRKTLQSGAFRS